MDPSLSNSLNLKDKELQKTEMYSLTEVNGKQACHDALSCTCFHTLVNASLCFVGGEISKDEFSELLKEILRSFTQAGFKKTEIYELVHPMGEFFTKACLCIEN